jgi:dihydrofolate reductase
MHDDASIILSLVVAIAENGVIGRQGALPWRLPGDLKRFRKLTSGHPVIMGRHTFEAIGRPLPERDNIVLTGDPARIPRLPGVLPAVSFEEALNYGRACAEARHVREIFVIGGRTVLDMALPFASRLYLAMVHGAPQGDVVWHAPGGDEWREIRSTEHRAGPGDDYDVNDVVLERIGASRAWPRRSLNEERRKH